MTREVTDVVEEYLEAIYRLQERAGVAKTSEIVKMLKVVPGTVTNTVERLEREGLVTHEPYRGVRLTGEGLRIALGVIRRHRLSERLLTDVLRVEWAKSHQAACELEHGISEEIVKNLEKALGHPQTCPHGNPIPTKCGGMVEEDSEPLSELGPQEGGIIVKITAEEEPEMLRYLAALGLTPGEAVRVVEKAPFDGPITVEIGGANRALSLETASIIEIKQKRPEEAPKPVD